MLLLHKILIIVNFYTSDIVVNQNFGKELNEVHISQILLGEDREDENAYIFVKQSAYGEPRDSKSLEKDILKEDFFSDFGKN